MKLPQMIRNLWIYRKVILFAVVLGVIATFVLSNNDPVRVNFPFLGEISSRSGVVMLICVLLGAGVTWIVMTFRVTLEEAKQEQE